MRKITTKSGKELKVIDHKDSAKIYTDDLNTLTPEDVQEALKTKPKKRVSGSKTASITASLDATPSEISQIIANTLVWYNRPAVKSDKECADRLNEFFTKTISTGEIPTVEKMCLALGTTRETVNQWERNATAGKTRSDMVKRAKEVMASIDAELVCKRKIPETTYIFRSKNFHGMRDQQEMVLTPNNKLGEEANEEELIEKYRKALPKGE